MGSTRDGNYPARVNLLATFTILYLTVPSGQCTLPQTANICDLLHSLFIINRLFRQVSLNIYGRHKLHSIYAVMHPASKGSQNFFEN